MADDASPIKPDLSKAERLGGFIGFTPLWQQGSFSVDCNCPRFIGGAGGGILAGALYEATTTTSYLWGIQGGIQYRSLQAKYLINEDTTLRSTDGSTEFRNIAIPFRHVVDVGLTSLFLQPYVKWYPIGPRVFVRVGATMNVIVGSSKEFRKTLLSNTVVLPNDDVVRLELDRRAIEAAGMRLLSENEVVVQEGPMSDVNRFQFGIEPALGIDLRVSKSIFLVPVVSYAIPLSSVSSRDTDFRIQSLVFRLELQAQLAK